MDVVVEACRGRRRSGVIGVILGVVWVHMTGRAWCGPNAGRKREEGAQRYGMRRTRGGEAIRAKRSARGAEAKAGGERGQAEMAAWRHGVLRRVVNV